MSTTTRAAERIAQLEAVNDEVAATVESCTAEEWSRVTAEEGWTVAATAHHIAEIQRRFARLAGILAAGQTFTPSMTMEQIHESNAQHAREYADADQGETLEILRESCAEIRALIEGMSDADLDRPAGIFGGNELTVDQVLENIVVGHAHAHLASIRDTLGQ